MSELRIVTGAEQLDYTKLLDTESGKLIVPVVVIDGTNLAVDGLSAVRMVGFANQEAVDTTLRDGKVTFYSRSQSGLWTKGKTSGNILDVRGVYMDCDRDSLLIDVKPVGPTCHTGANSCFAIPNEGE